MSRKVYQCIKGECVSKANSRRLVYVGGKPRFIKSKKGLEFIKTIEEQVAPCKFLEGDLHATIKIYYSSRRPDLDASLVLDGLEGIWFKNDRAFKRIITEKYLSKENPRVEVSVEEIEWDELGSTHKTGD